MSLKPSHHGGLKPKPLIFEPGHKNIATLIAFLMTIFLGLGAGWLVGGVLSGGPHPTEVEEGQVITQTEKTVPLNSIDEANAVKQAQTQQPMIEQQGDKDEPRTRARRHSVGSRRVYVTARAGEPIPLSVIKGKPLKKAFRQFKRVRIW
jgi:hypothetical protein